MLVIGRRSIVGGSGTGERYEVGGAMGGSGVPERTERFTMGEAR